MKKLAITGLLLIASGALAGCVALAGAGAGIMAYDEATEGDGKFDPLEEVRGEGDGKN